MSRLVSLSAQTPLEWNRNQTPLPGADIGRADVYEYIRKPDEHNIKLDHPINYQHANVMMQGLLRFPEPVTIAPESPSIGRGALLTSQENFCAEMLLSLKKPTLQAPSSPMSSPSSEASEDSDQYDSSAEEDNSMMGMSIVATPEEMMSIGQINVEASSTGLHFLEKESAIRKTTKAMKNKMKQKRCSGACSEHKRRHQRCPMECLNRRRDEAGLPRRMSLI